MLTSSNTPEVSSTPQPPDEGAPSAAGSGLRIRWGILSSLVVVALAVLGGAKWLPNLWAHQDGVETKRVQRGRLLVTLDSEGNVESADNRELKCQVAGGARIISIVPDGTRVEAGAELVQFDRSAFDQQQDEQRIIYERAVATKIQAEQDYQAAEISVREYLEGTFRKDLQTAETQITIAKQNLESNRNSFVHTERMFRKGFVTALQMEADKFAVEHSQLDLDAALIAKKVLQDFTKPKMLKQLEAVRDAADARRQSEQASVNLEKAKLDRITQQTKYCVIKAPQHGMVVYANDVDRRGASDAPQVEEGAMVRERQTVIRLPDLNNMQVQTTVHESRVPQIAPGMPARITILDRIWNGRVKSIASRPAPPQRYQAPTKNYAVFISIEGDTSGLKPGMTASVEMLLADLHDVCTVPVTAVVESNGEYYAWVKVPGGTKKHAVTIGKTDDKVLEIRSGLSAGDDVIVNPRATLREAMGLEEQQASEDDARFHATVQKTDSVAPKKDEPAVSQRSS